MSNLNHNPIIKNIPLKDIKPYSNNPRKKQNITKVVNSIKEFGFQQPIVVDKKNIIIVGHSRYEAGKELGLDKVPVIIADLSPVKAKAYRIADNRINQDSEWDFSKLKLEFKDISKLDFNLDSLGFEKNELDDLIIDEVKGFTDDDAVPDTPEKPITKLGDIWHLGKHRLLCGDSTKEEDVNKLMDGAKADMVFTDPPYGMFLNTDFSSMKGIFGDGNKYNKVIGDNIDFKPKFITSVLNNFKYCEEIFLWGADYYSEYINNKNNGSWIVWDKRLEESADKMYGSTFELCWSKAKHKRIMARVKWAGIFGLSKEDTKKRVHPTQKPIALLLWFFNYFSLKDKKNIIDLYGGSGSTLIACEKLDRKCYMMELDPKYCDVIIKRWEDYTGKSSKKI